MTPTPTRTPTVTPTPYIWATPTFYPTPDEVLIIYPATNPILVDAAEETVQIWHLADQQDTLNNFMTFILIVAIFLALADVRRRLMQADI